MNPIKILFPAGAALLFFFILTVQPLPATDGQEKLQQSLNQVLENSPVTTLGFTELQGIPSEIDKILLSLYLKNNSHPYWVTRNGPTQKAAALLSVLNIAAEDGLNPDDYRLTEIHNLWISNKPEDLARLDVMLTVAMGAFVTDMREGRAVTCLLDPKLFAAARDQKVDIIAVIQKGLSAPDLVQYLQQQAPQHQGYQSLKKVLADYRKLRSQDGWPLIPAGKVLKPGMQDDRLDPLIRRLTITGNLKQPPSPTGTYDGQLVEAVKHFQKRYNLEQDGIIGKQTMAALNIPVQDHIRRIIINMERWRWLPHTLDGQRLLANERRREVGILRAIGAHKSHIMKMFLSEALIISLTGGFIGIGIGNYLIHHLAGNFDLLSRLGAYTSVSLLNIFYSLLAMLIGVGVCLIGAAIPVIRLAALEPLQAIKDD
jgi:hypothetical protein